MEFLYGVLYSVLQGRYKDYTRNIASQIEENMPNDLETCDYIASFMLFFCGNSMRVQVDGFSNGD